MDEFDRREQAWIALNDLQRQVFARVQTRMRKAGLPRLNWYDILWALERSPEGLRPYQIQEELLFEQSSFSRMARRMADEGLISIETIDADGRGQILKITRLGMQMRADYWKVYKPAIDEEMANIQRKTDQLQAIANLLPKPGSF